MLCSSSTIHGWAEQSKTFTAAETECEKKILWNRSWLTRKQVNTSSEGFYSNHCPGCLEGKKKKKKKNKLKGQSWYYSHHKKGRREEDSNLKWFAFCMWLFWNMQMETYIGELDNKRNQKIRLWFDDAMNHVLRDISIIISVQNSIKLFISNRLYFSTFAYE